MRVGGACRGHDRPPQVFLRGTPEGHRCRGPHPGLVGRRKSSSIWSATPSWSLFRCEPEPEPDQRLTAVDLSAGCHLNFLCPPRSGEGTVANFRQDWFRWDASVRGRACLGLTARRWCGCRQLRWIEPATAVLRVNTLGTTPGGAHVRASRPTSRPATWRRGRTSRCCSWTPSCCWPASWSAS